MTRRVAIAGLPFLVLALFIEGAWAQSASQSASHSAIQDAVLAGGVGNIAVNNSAGAGNAQANIAVIGVGAESAGAAIRSRQVAARSTNGAIGEGHASAEIGSNAFRNASGIIAVNQSSGAGNAQSNLIAIAVGPFAEVPIDQLGSVNAAEDGSSLGASRSDSGRTRRSAIADSAFAGASGIVQVNQLAGSGNTTANVFALSIGAVPR